MRASYDGRLDCTQREDRRRGVGNPHAGSQQAGDLRTGAPRVAKDKIIIGNAGGEFGVRGYLSAYDAETGKLSWRFYTVPGNPGGAVRAADSQDRRFDVERQVVGSWRRRHGVGRNRLRPEAESRVFRHGQRLAVEPCGIAISGGDNLFLASIVAVNADTGPRAALPANAG